MAQIKGFNALDRPPDVFHQWYKKYSKVSLTEIENDPGVLDLWRLDPDRLPQGLTLSQYISSQDLRLAFDDFIRGGHAPEKETAPMTENIPVFSHDAIPGQHRVALDPLNLTSAGTRTGKSSPDRQQAF